MTNPTLRELRAIAEAAIKESQAPIECVIDYSETFTPRFVLSILDQIESSISYDSIEAYFGKEKARLFQDWLNNK